MSQFEVNVCAASCFCCLSLLHSKFLDQLVRYLEIWRFDNLEMSQFDNVCAASCFVVFHFYISTCTCTTCCTTVQRLVRCTHLRCGI